MLPVASVRIVEPWRPPIELLLKLALSLLTGENVLPPSVERLNTIGSALLFTPTNRVQLTYTLPLNCEVALLSTQTASLSLKSTGLVLSVANTGSDHVAPLSLERDTVMR